MKLHRIGTLAVLLLLAAAAPAAAAPVTVNLRVEGASSTIFEGPVTTDAKTIAGHPCDGTNGGANSTPGPTMTTALDDASIAHGFPWSGTWFDSIHDFSIDSVGPDASNTSTNQYWGYAYNWASSNVGGCQQEVHNGDDVLFAYDFFNKSYMLRLLGPAAAPVGSPVQVRVQQYGMDGTPGPAAGASVAGTPTDGNGLATLTFGTPGTQHLKATRSDAVRSNALDICVYIPGSGQCSTAAKDKTPPTVEIGGLIHNGARFRHGHGPRKLSGSATDSGGLFNVYFRLRRHSHAGCQWYSSKRSVFTRPHPHCKARYQVVHAQSGAWSYLLPKRLAQGKYTLDEKATDLAFNSATTTVSFTVK